MKVEFGKCQATGIEGEVVKIVVLVEAIAVVNELRMVVVIFHHLVDEVEGRDAHKQKQQRKRPRSGLGNGFLHYINLFVHLP